MKSFQLFVFAIAMTFIMSCGSDNSELVVRGKTGVVKTTALAQESTPAPEQSEDVPTRQEKDQCASRVSIDTDKIIFTGNKVHFDISSDKAIAVRVGGNKAELRVRLQS